MYQVQILSGPGLGDVVKGDGGYACNNTICYSYKSPATYQLFLRLQELLNTSANKLGIKLWFKPDGSIGANTVKIAAAVSDKLGRNAQYLFSAVSLEGAGGGTKEVLAQRADRIAAELAMFVGETVGPTSATGLVPASTGTNDPTGVQIPGANVNPATGVPYGNQPVYPTAGTLVTAVPNQSAVQTFPSNYQPPVINVTVPGAPYQAPSKIGPMIGIGALILAVGGAIVYSIHSSKKTA